MTNQLSHANLFSDLSNVTVRRVFRTDQVGSWNAARLSQNNLASALQEQGIRTGGAQGTELLAQAVDAYRNALEVYTREVFPSYYELVPAKLG
jgi:hypothetical protein